MKIINFTEIEKLHGMLIEAHIPHTFTPLWDGKQIRIFADTQMKEELDDCVIHGFSHGYEHGLLESYNLNYCNGFETAEEIFEGWQKMFLGKTPEKKVKKHYLFVDNESGETFFVEAESKSQAWDTLKDYFQACFCKYLGEFTPEESECYPYDVY